MGASGPYSSVWYLATYGAVTGYVHGAYLTAGSLRQVYRLPTTSKVVALTFDAGSDVGYAASILDTLQAQGVKATFGMTGKWAETNPALMRRIVVEGHGLINHTYDHKSLTGATTHAAPLTYDQRVEELWRTQAAADQIASATTKPWFRPPYGDEDASVLRDVWSRGYDYDVRWSVDSLGWRGLSRTQIVARVLDGLEPGAIYLLHVGSQSQDGPALAEIIQQLRSRGYGFATVGAYYR